MMFLVHQPKKLETHFYQQRSAFVGQNNKKLYSVAMHLRVQVRTDSGVHTFKQRTETTVLLRQAMLDGCCTHRSGQPTKAPQQHNQWLHKHLCGTQLCRTGGKVKTLH